MYPISLISSSYQWGSEYMKEVLVVDSSLFPMHAEQGKVKRLVLVSMCIRKCGCTLYVGLTGIVQMIIQKSTGRVPPLF